MKTNLTLALLLISTGIFSQVSEHSKWIWMKPDSIPDRPGVYGVMGVPDSQNRPASRYSACTWTTSDGKFWLYSGYSRSMFHVLDDMWQFDPVTNKWTWIKGDEKSFTSPGPGISLLATYGEKGVPAPGNNPNRRYGVATWVGADDKLWLFGGGDRNDLWNFDPVTRNWTWVKGDTVANAKAVYGTQGVADPANTPAGMSRSYSWKDKQGNFWMMAAGKNQVLWKYAPPANSWTWMKGDTTDISVHYGIAGVESPESRTGRRSGAVTWTDTSGRFWLFGGDLTNTLWRFDPSTNNWAWIDGDTTWLHYYSWNDSANPRVLALEVPSHRVYGNGWVDLNNNLWMYGGRGWIGPVQTATVGGLKYEDIVSLNQLWKYNPATNKWKLVNGDSTLYLDGNPALSAGYPRYGQLGVPSETNQPGWRNFHATWTDKKGNLWMMAGTRGVSRLIGPYRLMNDMWVFTDSNPVSVLPVNITRFSAMRREDEVVLTWATTTESHEGGFGIQRKHDNETNFREIAVVRAKEAAASASTITYTYSDLHWHHGKTYYRLKLIGADGGEKYTEIKVVEGLARKKDFVVYPNPVVDRAFTLRFTTSKMRSVSLMTVDGRVLYSWPGIDQQRLTISALAPGVYFLTVKDANAPEVQVEKITVN